MLQLIPILCIALYGVIISSVFALKPEITRILDVDDKKAGTLFATLMLSGAVSVLLISPLIDLFGYKIIVFLGFILTSVGMVMLRRLKTFKYTVLCYSVISIGSIAIISVGNTLLPIVLFDGKNAPAASNLGNVFYGFGAFSASFLIGLFIKKLGFSATISFFATLFLLTGILSLFGTYPDFKSSDVFINSLKLFDNQLFWAALIIIFFAVGVESSVGAWTNSILTEAGMSVKHANICLSLFFICLMLSRLLFSGVVTPENTLTILMMLFALSGCFMLALMFSIRRELIITLLFLLGFTTGSLVPTVFGFLFSNTPSVIHGTAFGFCFSTGLIGASIIPALIGIVSQKTDFNVEIFFRTKYKEERTIEEVEVGNKKYGIKRAFVVTVVCCILMVMILQIIKSL